MFLSCLHSKIKGKPFYGGECLPIMAHILECSIGYLRTSERKVKTKIQQSCAYEAKPRLICFKEPSFPIA